MGFRGAQVLNLAADGVGQTMSPAEHATDLADLLVTYLEQLGVEYVLGVPGGHIEPLYNALARSSHRSGVQHILARHEAGAAFMADLGHWCLHRDGGR